jgi:hypothetical protein
MVSYSTLAELERAERSTAELGLERTSGRLSTLRRQLEGFKRLSEAERERAAYWTMAKLDDAKSCLAQERHSCSSVRDEHEWDAKALSAVTKGIVYAGSIAVYARVMEALSSSGEEAGGLIAASAAIAAAVYAMKIAIERTMGVNRFDRTVGSVERIIDECRTWVSLYLEG